MMPRIIFKCPFIKGGTRRASAHLNNYVVYTATRDGAEPTVISKPEQPATKNQTALVEQLLREFPLSRSLFEYEDYLASPTMENASEFITRTLEDNYDSITKKENYIDYIANRPRAVRVGSHALFNGENDPLVLTHVAGEVSHHDGNVWLPIISLRREDAIRLGYDSPESWRELLSSCVMDMAEAMRIPWKDFRWYAAFHDEGHHPHIHMICYSADPSKGFLTKKGIEDIKSHLAKEIFQQELTEIYQQQTLRRDELTQKSSELMEEYIEQMRSGVLQNERIETLLLELSQRLRHLSGKKQYGYLKAPLKAIVDEIVDELGKDARITSAYELWYEQRENILRTYKNKFPERLPLSKQKEFKRIKNIIIEEAVQLEDITQAHTAEGAQPEYPEDGPIIEKRKSSRSSSSTADSQTPSQGDMKPQETSWQSPYLFHSTTRLLHHMSRIFREQTPQPGAHGLSVTADSKLKRKLREKKTAQGHRPNDHEEMQR